MPPDSALSEDAVRRNVLIGLGLFAVVTLAILVRMPFAQVPMITDEGAYAYVARFWSSTYQLYRDIPFDRPQGIFLIYEAILATIGESTAAIRLSAALAAALTALALFFVTRRAAGPGAPAWVAAILFAVLSTSPSIEGFTANAETFVVLPLTLAAHCTWSRRWFWAGLLSGLAIVIKPSGLSGTLLSIAWAFYTRAGAKAAAVCFLASCIAPAASVAHGASIGFDAYWSSFVDRRLLLYSVVEGAGTSQLSRLWHALRAVAPACAPALLLAATSLRRAKDPRHFGSIWLAASLLGMAIGGEWHKHYFIQWVPPLCYSAGLACSELHSRRAQLTGALAFATGLAIYLVVEAKLWALAPLDLSWHLYHSPAYMRSDVVVRHIQENTAPDDVIYIAFAEAEYYYLSQRKAAVPQLFWREVDYSKSIFDQVIATVRAREPSMIVWAGPAPRWISHDEFARLLHAAGYVHEATLDPVLIFARAAR